MSTMREVAERAGVSAKTVSRVINNDRYISADVRRRVEAAVTELAYVPNVLARTFRSGRDAAIGIAVPDVSDPFFAAVIHAVERTARARGAAVFVTSLGEDGEYEQPALEALLSRQLAGLITTPVADSQAYLAPWKTRTALVFIDRPPNKLTGADYVVQDDVAGAYTATEHLIAHGHQRVAFLGDRYRMATTQRRLQGYRSAQRAAGFDPDDDLIQTDIRSEADAAAAMTKIHGLPDPPTAVFSSNATCSIALVPVLQSASTGPVAVIGFGDFPLAGSLPTPFTVIDQDPDALGSLAASRTFARIDKPAQRLRRATTVPVSLVIRRSCGPH